MTNNSKRIVAIHQPNFLPWLGYFNKIAMSDVFILLDDVQFQKTGGCWSNRVKLFIGGAPNWVTVPVVRSYHGTRLITEIEINNTTAWRIKMLRAIQHSYSRAFHFVDVFPVIESLISVNAPNLAEFNCHVITQIVQRLGLAADKIIRSSSIPVAGTATDRLIALTRAVGGTAYMCGGGATGYQEDQKFAEAGIGLVYQNFLHPVYPQKGISEFIPGLSIVDGLMNCGWDETGRLIGGKPTP